MVMHRFHDLPYSQHPPMSYFQPRGPRGFQNYQQRENAYWNSAPNLTENHNEGHWCETCDRGFPNLGLLERHNMQHQKCNIDGCQFIAHPKVITKHIQMQHSTGLFKKIGNLTNPEEIKKWLEERKKKYPTKQNVEKKAAETKEKIERGEKMGLRHERSKRNSEPGTKQKHPFDSENHYKDRKLKRNLNINITHKKPSLKRNHSFLPPPDDHKKLKPFTGIRDLIIDYDVDDNTEQDPCCDSLIEDEEDIQQSFITTKELPICGALSSLICNYGSSDEETDLPIHPKKHVTATQNDNQGLQQNNHCHTNTSQQQTTINEDRNENKHTDNDSGPEEVKVMKETSSEMEPMELRNNPTEQAGHSTFISDKKVKKNYLHNQHKKTFCSMRVNRKLPSTLLQKLLHKEIRKERNTVLQCIRHIVKHNYFDTNDK